MAKVMEKPEEIKVSINVKGVPLNLSRNGKRERINGIYDKWRVAGQWLGTETENLYFRVKTSKGLVCDIYHDMTSNQWYLVRIYD